MDIHLRRRVKVYQLEDGQWEDKGTGYVSCTLVESLGGAAIVVRSEENNSILLETKISHEDIYQKQQETLIVWAEPETGVDLALSFQAPLGCADIWEQICSVRGVDVDDTETSNQLGNGQPITLPTLELENLEQIVELINESTTSARKDIKPLVEALLKENYLRKMLDFFLQCEKTDNRQALHIFFLIFKSLVLINEVTLFEQLISDENILDFMGVFEYDSEFTENNMIRHRQYMSRENLFKQVVPIDDKVTLQKVHQNFKLHYLKDVVLPRVIDDNTLATVNQKIYFNNVEIISYIQNNGQFLEKLFRKLKEENKEDQKKVIQFLQELCSLAKNLQVQNRNLLYKNLTDHGMIEYLELFFCDPEDDKIRLSCLDILNCIILHDAGMLRKHILSQQSTNYRLFHQIAQQIIFERDTGIKSQLAELLKTLLDTDNSNDESSDKNEFLAVFYDKIINSLVSPIMDDKEMVDVLSAEKPPESVSAYRFHLCELLAFFVQHHGYRIKYYLLGRNVPSRVLRLVKTPDLYVVLASLRFFRAFIGQKDEFYYRLVIKNNQFDPIIDIFKKNGDKYNLLNSAIIEMFDYIRKENITSLVVHIVERYGEFFSSIKYVETFTQLMLKYDQHMEVNQKQIDKGALKSSRDRGPRKRRRGDGDDDDDDDDEAYFNEDDDVSTTRNEVKTTDVKLDKKAEEKLDSMKLKPLVDYDDEEEERKRQEANHKGKKLKVEGEEKGREREKSPGRRNNSNTKISISISSNKYNEIDGTEVSSPSSSSLEEGDGGDSSSSTVADSSTSSSSSSSLLTSVTSTSNSADEGKEAETRKVKV